MTSSVDTGLVTSGMQSVQGLDFVRFRVALGGSLSFRRRVLVMVGLKISIADKVKPPKYSQIQNDLSNQSD